MRFIKALVAFVVLAALLVGVPAGLITGIGNPWPPGGWSEVQLLSDRTIIGAVAVLVWLFWAQFAASVLWEVPAALRGIEAPRNPFALPGEQHTARVLVHMLLAVGITAAALAPSAMQRANAATVEGHHPATHAAAVATHAPNPTSASTATAAPHRQKASTDLPTVTVKDGDTLWGLAQTHLGDGQRWKEIRDLNVGTKMSDGSVFSSSRDIQPGWQLKLPATATGLPSTAHSVEVEPGDSLSRIAEQELGDASLWPRIYQLNHDEIGSNPNLIQPGVDLDLTATSSPEQTADTGDQPAAKHHQSAPATPPQQTPARHPGSAPHDTAPGTNTPAVPNTPSVPAVPEQTQAPAQPSAPVHRDAPAPAASTSTSDQADSGHGNILSAPWIVASLAGGAVLASVLLLELRRRRRRQFEIRTPGRAIAVPPPEDARYEKTFTVAGYPLEKSIEFLNAALRQLSLDITAAHETAPPLAAVELTDEFATLHLTAPADLPDPWIGSDDKQRWTVTTGALGAADPHSAPSPFPLLITVGRDDEGHWWLLNLEHLGTITIGGDTERARDLLRSMSCELALAPWADSARIDGVGIGSQAARMQPARIRYHDTDTSATDSVLADALEMIDRADGLDTDTATGRSTQVDDELWLARLLLVDAAETDESSLQRLIDLIADHPDHTGASVVLADRDLDGGFAIDLTPDGRLRVEKAQLDLLAVGLPEEDAEGITRIMEQAEVTSDVPVPVDETATEGLGALIDSCGSIRREYTLPRNVAEISEASDEEPARSILEADDQAYIDAAATTAEDLEQVAPRIPATVCEAVEAETGTVDDDYKAWITTDPTRPRLRLLGEVKLTAYGDISQVTGRFDYYTELAAFLASKSRDGATTDDVIEAFGLSRNRVRVDMTALRSWLGENALTGEPLLPDANKAPAKKRHHRNVYQLDTGPGGLIVDTKIFETKKARAQARGENGIADLREALTLVEGRPYSALREDGWTWMLDTLIFDRLDHIAGRMVADTAHILTTHYLKQGELNDALAVAQIGRVAAPEEETMQINLARVLKARGQAAEAESLLSEKVYNRTDEGLAPRDLSDRSKKIIAKMQATG